MSHVRGKRPATILVLLVIQALNTLSSLALLLLFRLDPAFLAIIGYVSNLFFSPTGFSTVSIILAVICLFLLLCGPSRRYFGIGASTQAAPAGRSGDRDTDPWDHPDKQ